MKIAVASGKGGTGKTTISVALGTYLARKGLSVEILDCDVEEPNANIFLKAPIEKKEKVYSLVPHVNLEQCTGCGACDSICEFSAIVLVKGKPLVFPDMCHSCGGCTLVCPQKAISEKEKEIGIIEEGQTETITYRGGRLNISEAMSPPLIKYVKKQSEASDITIIDSPPGTSCPVIEAIDKTDYVILVTEPTPFGLHDLKLAVGMVRETGIPFGVVINRSDGGDYRVVHYCGKEQVDVIAEIPQSRTIAENYSKGEFVNAFISSFSDSLENIRKAAGLKDKQVIV